MFRVDLKSMAAAHQLHQGTNLRGHLVWARLPHFRRHLAIRNISPDDEDLDILQLKNNKCTDSEILCVDVSYRKNELKHLLKSLPLKGTHLVENN